MQLLIKRQQAGRQIQIAVQGIARVIHIENQAFLAIAVGIKILVGIIKQHRLGIGFKHRRLFGRAFFRRIKGDDGALFRIQFFRIFSAKVSMSLFFD